MIELKRVSTTAMQKICGNVSPASVAVADPLFLRFFHFMSLGSSQRRDYQKVLVLSGRPIVVCKCYYPFNEICRSKQFLPHSPDLRFGPHDPAIFTEVFGLCQHANRSVLLKQYNKGNRYTPLADSNFS